MLKRFIPLALMVAVSAIFAADSARAQTRIVAACGNTAPFGSEPAGGPGKLSVDPNGVLCTNASGGGTGLGTVATPNVAGYSNGGTAAPWAGAANGPYVDVVNGSTLFNLLSSGSYQPGATLNASSFYLGIGGYLAGAFQPISLKQNGAVVEQAVVNSAETSGGPTPVMKATLTTASQVKATAGQVYKVQCDNPAASGYAYAQLINTAGGGALGANVIDFVAIPGQQTGGFALAIGEQFSNGIWIGAATTATGSTAVSTAINCSVSFQ